MKPLVRELINDQRPSLLPKKHILGYVIDRLENNLPQPVACYMPGQRGTVYLNLVQETNGRLRITGLSSIVLTELQLRTLHERGELEYSRFRKVVLYME